MKNDYGMYTKAGDMAVAAVVEAAYAKNMKTFQMLAMLRDLAKIEAFAEATDTQVREMAVDALWEMQGGKF